MKTCKSQKAESLPHVHQVANNDTMFLQPAAPQHSGDLRGQGALQDASGSEMQLGLKPFSALQTRIFFFIKANVQNSTQHFGLTHPPCFRDIDKVDDLMQDITEQRELAQEISDAISKPVGFGEEFDDVGDALLFPSFFWFVLIPSWSSVTHPKQDAFCICY